MNDLGGEVTAVDSATRDTRPGGLPGLPRILGDVGVAGSGPVLIAIGGLHGNESAGALALQRVCARLEADPVGLRGRFVGLAGNLQALAAGQRYLEWDLNRLWHREHVARVAQSELAAKAENAELRALTLVLHTVMAEHDDVYALDIHSTSGGGSPFTTFDDTLANRALAFEIPVPHVLGLEEELAGTLITYLNNLGCTAIGFESGQHLDPRSVDRAEAATWITLRGCGVLRRGRPEVAAARQLLARETAGLPDVVEVRHRHATESDDGFVMEPGYENFQPIRRGELLARVHDRPITASKDGMILMPLYQRQGEDGFFVIGRVSYWWLRLSALLRRLHVDRVVHLLPGVQRDLEGARAFYVDRRRARWLALQVFHLLGYKRLEKDEQFLHMIKRD